MLNSSDIVHPGLRQVYRTGKTGSPPPGTPEWQHSRRRLLALRAAKTPADAALPAYVLCAGQRKAHEFGPLPSGGVIEFDWAGVYAQSVDWR